MQLIVYGGLSYLWKTIDEYLSFMFSGEHDILELVTKRLQTKESGFSLGDHDILKPMLED